MRTLHRSWKRLFKSRIRRDREPGVGTERQFQVHPAENFDNAEAGESRSASQTTEAFARDVRYALRSLRQNREFAAAAILSLALGIGATTAIFSVADSALLRTLPYPQPERLVTVSLGGAMPAPVCEQFRQKARSIERAALFVNWNFNLGGPGEPERIPAARVSAELFDLLGVRPQLGRTFTPDEDQKGRANVVVIGDGLWKRRFGGDPRILGKTVRLSALPYTVIGVMPPGFRFPEGPEHNVYVGPFPPAEMWRPMGLEDWERTCGSCYNFAMLARLRPGVTPIAAAKELTAIRNRELRPEEGQESVTVLSLQNALTGKVRTSIQVLLGAMALALLIACANVANLLLVRGLRRREEAAIRYSLGATQGRLIQQGFTEAVTLAVCAAGLALPIAWGALKGLMAMAPPGIPGLGAARLDVRMFGFSLCLAFLTAIIFGVAPAVLVARAAPGSVVKAGARAATSAPSRFREALVVGEFALSLILLVGAGLLARSFVKVSAVSLGFRAENVLTMQLSLPQARYDDQQRAAFVEHLVGNCGALPGVTHAAAITTLPLTGDAEGWGLLAEDDPTQSNWVDARIRAVTPGYFATLGIRQQAGRDFDVHDTGKPNVAIVSQGLARRLWPGVASPLGRRLKRTPPLTVVGIVDDTRASGIEADVLPYMYVSYGQFAPPEFAVTIRSSSGPANLARAAKAEVWRLDKEQPVTHVAVMKQLVSDAIAPRRFQAVVMTLFAVFAVVLAAIGIYGVLSYSVGQRTHEIGIRMALGASRGYIVGRVMWQACVLAAAGAAMGLGAASQLVRFLRSLLFGVPPTDVLIFLGCTVLLLAVAAAASLIPARRAAKLDPMSCLRHE